MVEKKNQNNKTEGTRKQENSNIYIKANNNYLLKRKCGYFITFSFRSVVSKCKPMQKNLLASQR